MTGLINMMGCDGFVDSFIDILSRKEKSPQTLQLVINPSPIGQMDAVLRDSLIPWSEGDRHRRAAGSVRDPKETSRMVRGI
jgi:hypothetical protein